MGRAEALSHKNDNFRFERISLGLSEGGITHNNLGFAYESQGLMEDNCRIPNSVTVEARFLCSTPASQWYRFKTAPRYINELMNIYGWNTRLQASWKVSYSACNLHIDLSGWTFEIKTRKLMCEISVFLKLFLLQYHNPLGRNQQLELLLIIWRSASKDFRKWIYWDDPQSFGLYSDMWGWSATEGDDYFCEYFSDSGFLCQVITFKIP